MTGGKEGETDRPEFSFISSHYPTFFYCSVILLAAWSPKMALKLDELESVAL